ncbi:MAG: type II secretion system F family protein [Fibrobacteres bacterium]|nr:type II secretion system F family protein [Fibrobacterota bacterium]
MQSQIVFIIETLSFSLSLYLLLKCPDIAETIKTKLIVLNNQLPINSYRSKYEAERANGVLSSWPDFNRYLIMKEGVSILVLLAVLFSGGSSSAALMAAAAVFMLPELKRRELHAKRGRELRNGMVPFLDIMSMMLESGVALLPALKKFQERSKGAIFGREVGLLVLDLDMGLTKDEAFGRFKRRLSIEEANEFASTVLQSEKRGSPLSTALRQLSLRLRTTRLQKAEKLAYEAPVKLLAPLALFIFPVIFIVMIGPIILRFIYGN